MTSTTTEREDLAVSLDAVSRTFPGSPPVEAVKAASLKIAGGEYVSIVGPSGSGKSTLLHLLGCLDQPTDGTYHLKGIDVGALPDRKRTALRGREIGFVFQSFHLVPRLTAAGNVELPMTFAGVERAQRREKVARALQSVGLEERVGHRPEQLSGGEQQRVAIARAIAMDPAILLADEPTGNLDSRSGQEVIELLEGMNAEGLTVIMVTHNPEIAKRARHRIRLADGRLVEEKFA